MGGWRVEQWRVEHDEVVTGFFIVVITWG